MRDAVDLVSEIQDWYKKRINEDKEVERIIYNLNMYTKWKNHKKIKEEKKAGVSMPKETNLKKKEGSPLPKQQEEVEVEVEVEPVLQE